MSNERVPKQYAFSAAYAVAPTVTGPIDRESSVQVSSLDS